METGFAFFVSVKIVDLGLYHAKSFIMMAGWCNIETEPLTGRNFLFGQLSELCKHSFFNLART